MCQACALEVAALVGTWLLFMRPLRPGDKLVQELVKLATRKDYRRSKSRCVVAGTKLVEDLARRYRFFDLLSTPGVVASADFQKIGADATHAADARSLRRISQLTSFEGLIGTLSLPGPVRDRDLADPRLILALDYIEDPGVLGTLLRTAVAFQWQAVFILPHCADPFHPVSLRASQGALFEIPHLEGTHDDLKKLCLRRGLQLCVSHSSGVDIGAAAYEPPPLGMALLLREEHVAPWAPPRSAMKIKIPDPWRNTAEQPPDGLSFDHRAMDVAVNGGILMHHIKHFNYPQVSRSSFLASPR